MPIYEYQCEQCGPFETMQKVSDRPLRRCPTCKGKVSKLISNTSFQLKGTGWYITDYARKDKGGSKGSETKSDSSDSTKSESPAASDSAKPAAGSKNDSGTKAKQASAA